MEAIWRRFGEFPYFLKTDSHCLHKLRTASFFTYHRKDGKKGRVHDAYLAEVHGVHDELGNADALVGDRLSEQSHVVVHLRLDDRGVGFFVTIWDRGVCVGGGEGREGDGMSP